MPSPRSTTSNVKINSSRLNEHRDPSPGDFFPGSLVVVPAPEAPVPTRYTRAELRIWAKIKSGKSVHAHEHR